MSDRPPSFPPSSNEGLSPLGTSSPYDMDTADVSSRPPLSSLPSLGFPQGVGADGSRGVPDVSSPASIPETRGGTKGALSLFAMSAALPTHAALLTEGAEFRPSGGSFSFGTQDLEVDMGAGTPSAGGGHRLGGAELGNRRDGGFASGGANEEVMMDDDDDDDSIHTPSPYNTSPPSSSKGPFEIPRVATSRPMDMGQRSSASTDAGRSMARNNSFDSTAATFGSPRLSVSGLESPFSGNGVVVRMQTMIAMRHAERLDEVDQSWCATAQRPWDPPITSKGREMAFEAGRRLRLEGWEITRVVVSPFLRCIQTAVEVVAALATDDSMAIPGEEERRREAALQQTKIKVSIDYGLGEVMNPRVIRSPPPLQPDGSSQSWLPAESELLAQLPKAWLEPSSIPTMSELARFPEVDEEAHMRFARAFDLLADTYPDDNILCITHGEAVSVSVSRLLPVTVYEVCNCGFSWAQRSIYGRGDDDEGGGGGGGGQMRPAGEWELLTDSGSTGISWVL
eukprot:TRINITY_DN2290_c1_g1_i2.p1 TRINITY_DN2290_c1_g1~~TRINITY_DN2290_c1_g1_i2.p1  ORF type:complete len:510 (-),score=98.83 TRINITY_DN2290_c1_g1_i2:335-1864(-)